MRLSYDYRTDMALKYGTIHKPYKDEDLLLLLKDSYFEFDWVCTILTVLVGSYEPVIGSPKICRSYVGFVW
jgi:hypothetical protein